MSTNRLEAFTDGVLAIVITIMVLELQVPAGATPAAAREAFPVLLAYILSFINVGIYWSNHHHLFQATDRVDGRVLWCNLFLLFWLSLLPFVIRWLDEADFAAAPTAAYGFVLSMASLGWLLTGRAIVARNGIGSAVARALGRDRKSWWSMFAYGVATAATLVSPLLAIGCYVAITALWLIPDSRLEHALDD
ncbi:TMEM175 family protein [Sphingosinithalassobacter portus]|uniref:TMEM175 family protein n=1 Tax=Stakelama portus TaxID=2676234 RepID=UPI000D6E4EBB|nr:TMEM175 family protein [Sphingosinithalassobacter portus]